MRARWVEARRRTPVRVRISVRRNGPPARDTEFSFPSGIGPVFAFFARETR
jgi:hypothetical protein